VRVLETAFQNLQLRLYRTSERTVRVLETSFQNLQLRLYRTSERTVRVLETSFQNLQCNYDYMELANVQCEF